MQQSIKTRISPALKSLLLRTIISLALFSVSRAVFLFYNYDSFISIKLKDWFSGIWFDTVSYFLLFLPFVLISILPFAWQKNKILRFIQKWLFVIPFALFIALNLLDTAYFNFTQKRSTADLFAIVSAGNDLGQLVGSFVSDYWLLIVCLILFFIVSLRIYKKTDFVKHQSNAHVSWKANLIIFAIGLPFSIITGRGGLGIYKPLSPIDATLFTEPQNVAFVLNTPFTLIKSIGKTQLEKPKFYTTKELNKLVSFVHKSNPQNILPNKTNVVVIMLESFGNEWIGKFNNSRSFTPFLDSLLDKSWYFEYGISNGKKSIEAVPTITASMPTLMDNPYISSTYSNNNLNAIPEILNQKGYSTIFYHGATNGSMRFNSFSKQIGFEEYVGRFEYNNDAHFDKTWGILDEYFNPWTMRQLNEENKPFFATLFTLSSHHPYFVPKNWRNKVRIGPHPICKSIHYGDISLQKLFEEAKQQSWYKNTLFVLVADHTSSSNNALYSSRSYMYRVPIAFFDPSGKIKPKREKIIFQQADIMPTVLDLLNIRTSYYAVGHSYFSKEPREAISYLEGTYCYFKDGFMLSFSNGKSLSLIRLDDKSIIQEDVSKKQQAQLRIMEKRLRALIQRYNTDLIENKTIVL